MNQNTNPTEISQALQTIKAVADTIQELKQVPSGHLYAVLMGKMSLANYEKIITILVNSGLVAQDPSHLLRWVGTQA